MKSAPMSRRIPTDAAMSELADRLRSAFQCACDSDACQDTRVDAAARLESIEAQRRVLREALVSMRRSHGMHGPCTQNSCSDCKHAYVVAVAALAATDAGQDGE